MKAMGVAAAAVVVISTTLVFCSSAASATTTTTTTTNLASPACFRENVEQCGYLMMSLLSTTTTTTTTTTTDSLSASSTTATATAAVVIVPQCDCYDFCNGLLVGCGASTSTSHDDEENDSFVRAVAAAGDVGGCDHIESERVRGCTVHDLSSLPPKLESQVPPGDDNNDNNNSMVQQDRRSLQQQMFGTARPACPAGQFRRGVGAPCVNCLRCAWNAVPLVACVEHAADPNQCQCNAGLVPNGRGGCLINPPTTTTGAGSVSVVNTDRPRPCIGCGFNSSPAPGVTCVTNAADPNQCQCNTGYLHNGRGGCYRPFPDALTTTVVGTAPSPSVPVPVTMPVTMPVAMPVTMPVAMPIMMPVPTSSTTMGIITECSPGTFRNGANNNAPCVACLNCPNPLVSCVTDLSDPAQCAAATVTIGSGSIATTGTIGSIGVPLPPCPAGTFRNGRGAPCVSCLRCAWNARAIVPCVTYAADPAQCQCNDGYRPNYRGGCLDDNDNDESDTTMAALESAAAAPRLYAAPYHPLVFAVVSGGLWMLALMIH